MNVAEGKKALKMILSSDKQIITPFIQGSPGIGKSQIVTQVKEELGLDHLIDIRMSQHDNTDIKGVPHITGGSLGWISPNFLPLEGSSYEGTSGIFFLDEINRAQPDTLQSIFEVVHDRSIGGRKFLSTWKIVAAGNIGHEDGTDVFEMDSALKNRFCFIEIDKVDFVDWYKWAEEHNVNKDVMEFLKINLSKLHYVSGNTHVTPRSWDKLSQHLNEFDSVKDKLEFVNLCGKGIIYDSYVTFYDYLRQNQEILPEDIVNKYESIKDKLSKLERADLYNLLEQLMGYVSDSNKEITKKQAVNIGRFILESLEDDAKIAAISKLHKANADLSKRITDDYPKTEKALAEFASKDLLIKVFESIANSKSES